MSEKFRSGLIMILIVAGYLSWQAYNSSTRVRDIERAEFRVLYSSARDRLDAFSLCRSAVDARARAGAQIKLQQDFATLKETISDSRFSSDQKLLDREIQLKDQNQKTGMEDQTVRCARLSTFADAEKQDIVDATSRVEQFLEKH